MWRGEVLLTSFYEMLKRVMIRNDIVIQHP